MLLKFVSCSYIATLIAVFWLAYTENQGTYNRIFMVLTSCKFKVGNIRRLSMLKAFSTVKMVPC
jgi:hypothetical protein